jgi:CRP-like cAMP-binding protein
MAESEHDFPRLLSILKESDLFHDLTMHEMDALITHLRMIRTQKGFEIIRQGDSWDSFYVVISGRVSVKVKKGSRITRVAELGKGEFFGEMALLTLQPRNATITSEEISELLVLKKSEFDNILMKHPVRAQKIRKAYVERASKNKAVCGRSTRSASQNPRKQKVLDAPAVFEKRA